MIILEIIVFVAVVVGVALVLGGGDGPFGRHGEMTWAPQGREPQEDSLLERPPNENELL
jgi:hypothetical protein